VEFKKGNDKHIASCLAIAKELPQYFTKEAIKSMILDFRKNKLYIAIDEDDVVAFCVIKQKTISVAEILWMGVVPSRQHEGIGLALINYISNELKSSETRLLMVKTLSSDVEYPPYEITRKFYEKIGFIHLDTIHHYPLWDNDNAYAIYVKVL
jgi:ribosomal protein S18 acetylase RimI-like enzyme